MTEQTTPLDTAARQEAERRYPNRFYLFGGETVEDMRVAAFEAGARWGAEQADAALTKALGQRDAVAVTAERMTSYARQAEAVLREVAALADDMSDELDMLRAEPGPVALSYANCTAMDLRRIRAILARAEQMGADR